MDKIEYKVWYILQNSNFENKSEIENMWETTNPVKKLACNTLSRYIIVLIECFNKIEWMICTKTKFQN